MRCELAVFKPEGVINRSVQNFLANLRCCQVGALGRPTMMADENEKRLSLSEYVERVKEIDAADTERSRMRDVPWLLFAVFLALGVGIGSFEIARAVIGDVLALALAGFMFAAVIVVVDKRG